MSESLADKNARFIDFNKELIEAAMHSGNLNHQGLQSKVLLVAIFDSLTKAANPTVGSKVRFIAGVTDHTTWNDCERVSLLHLVRAFEVVETVASGFTQLRTWAESKYAHAFPASTRLLSRHAPIRGDPLVAEIEALWPQTAEGKPQALGEVKKPGDLQHKNLLWLYRNSLVHEYRVPGRGVESISSREDDPFYQEVSTITRLDGEAPLKFTNHWELVYPTRFFHRLVRDALASIARLHEENGTSPFQSYSEGTYWIPSFNEEVS